MSGRIRSIKPEWLDDERLVLASSDARTLSIALLLLADDYGNGRASLPLLAGRVFPGKVLETAANALAELSGWFVELYEADGQSYFHIRNWAKHQKVDKPGKPRVPGPSATLAKVPEAPEKPHETLAPDLDQEHRNKDHDQERASGTVVAAAPVEDSEQRSRATPCPADLPDKLIARGVHTELAEHLKCDVASVVHELRAFRDFWVVGKGTGQSRSFWAGKARQWVIDQHAQNKLAPPGATEHAQTRTVGKRQGRGGPAAALAEVLPAPYHEAWKEPDWMKAKS